VETNVLFEMQYGLGGTGSSLRKFKAKGRILAPFLPVGSVSGSPVAWILENKFVTLRETAIAYVYLHCLHSASWGGGHVVV
jgi:hypothetical protein